MRRLRLLQIHTAFAGCGLHTIFIANVIDHNKFEMYLNGDSIGSVCKRVKACVSFWRLHIEHLRLRLLMRWNGGKSGVFHNQTLRIFYLYRKSIQS